MHTCPYCNEQMNLGVAEDNVLTYQEPALVATPCCFKPIRLRCAYYTTVAKINTDEDEDDWGVEFAKPKCKLNLKPWQEVIYSFGDEQITTRIKRVEAFQHEGHDLYRIALEVGYEATFYQDSDRVLSDTMFGYGNGVNKIFI